MATKTKKERRNIYAEVTDRIMASLEAGVAPWHKPWRSVNLDRHRNFKSMKPYRGINIFLLGLTAMDAGYDYPYWLTFKQAQAMGGQVKKGEKGSLVVFWKMLRIEDDKDLDANGKPKLKTIPMLRHYVVFNIEQVEGVEKIDTLLATQPDATGFDPIEAAQDILDDMPDAPEFSHGGNRAFYNPAADAIRLPDPERFDAPEDYYRTAFHEEAHATGNEKRLGRVKEWTSFGSEPYGKEELVAEMTSAMLASVAGIDGNDQSASYVGGWLDTIKGDPKLVVVAAAQAQKAADFILGDQAEVGDNNGKEK